MNRILVIVIYSMLLVGCVNTQMYEGEERSAEQIVIIKVGKPSRTWLSNPPQLAILEIDRRAIGRGMTWDVPSFEVLPGTHIITTALAYYGYQSVQVDRTDVRRISFDTKAGETYIVFYRRNGGNWTIFVTEESSGTIVAE